MAKRVHRGRNEMNLRYYQKAAINAVNHAFNENENNALVVMPTGSGKTPVIAEIVKNYYQQGKRVCIVTHRSELITQNHRTLKNFIDDDSVGIGLYCAKLNQKDTKQNIIISSIQSIGKQANLFSPFDLIVIDEVHLLSPANNTLYQRFIADIRKQHKQMKLLGLTATPYRMKSGYIYEGDDCLFNHLTYEISVAELMYEKYLTPLVSIKGKMQFDIENVAVIGGEFVTKQMNEKMNTQHKVFENAVNEIIKIGNEKQRKSWVLFTNSIEQVLMVQRLLTEQGIDSKAITGNTKQDERVQTIDEFKAGQLRCIVNCKVLTTGFDAPNIDLIGLLMATASPSLYVQIMGRGTRNAPDKENCLILDYGGNVERHGCIDDVMPKGSLTDDGEAPTKTCPACNAIVALRTAVCPNCGFIFPVPEEKGLSPLYCGGNIATQKYAIRYIQALEHQKVDRPPCVRVNYHTEINGQKGFISEYFSPNSSGKAKYVCDKLFRERYRTGMPASLSEAIKLVHTKPIPRYVLAKVNSSGYFQVSKVGFD